MGRKVETALRIPKYVLVNAAGTVVDTAVLWLLSHHIFHSFAGEYLLSPFISFECAVISGVTLSATASNSSFVFALRRLKRIVVARFKTLSVLGCIVFAKVGIFGF